MKGIKTRKHHNNRGDKQIKQHRTERQVWFMALRLKKGNRKRGMNA